MIQFAHIVCCNHKQNDEYDNMDSSKRPKSELPQDARMLTDQLFLVKV